MSFSNLPSETILAIASYVLPSHLSAFAHVNSFTYHTLHSRLLPILKYQHNRSAVTKRFGSTAFNSNLSEYLCTHPSLIDMFNGQNSQIPSGLQYLRLNSDLYWLRPLPESVNKSHVWSRGIPETEDRMTRLLQQAKDVDVEIPPEFVRFMCSKDMIESMYLGGDYFALGDSLIKCRAEDDKNGGGFVITFFHDQQDCWYWGLYVAPGGVSCVLDFQMDPECYHCIERDMLEVQARESGDEKSFWMQKEVEGSTVVHHPKPETYKGVPMSCHAIDGNLTDSSFEEWLCTKYFEGWISATLDEGDEDGDEDEESEESEEEEEQESEEGGGHGKLNARQLEFLRHMWPRNGRRGKFMER